MTTYSTNMRWHHRTNAEVKRLGLQVSDHFGHLPHKHAAVTPQRLRHPFREQASLRQHAKTLLGKRLAAVDRRFRGPQTNRRCQAAPRGG